MEDLSLITEPAEFKYCNGLVFLTYRSGTKTYERALALDTLRESVRRANRVLDEAAEQRPIPMRKLRPV